MGTCLSHGCSATSLSALCVSLVYETYPAPELGADVVLTAVPLSGLDAHLQCTVVPVPVLTNLRSGTSCVLPRLGLWLLACWPAVCSGNIPVLSMHPGGTPLAEHGTPLVEYLCGTPLAPAAASLLCRFIEDIRPELTETPIDGDALTLCLASVGIHM